MQNAFVKLCWNYSTAGAENQPLAAAFVLLIRGCRRRNAETKNAEWTAMPSGFANFFFL